MVIAIHIMLSIVKTPHLSLPYIALIMQIQPYLWNFATRTKNRQ